MGDGAVAFRMGIHEIGQRAFAVIHATGRTRERDEAAGRGARDR